MPMSLDYSTRYPHIPELNNQTWLEKKKNDRPTLLACVNGNKTKNASIFDWELNVSTIFKRIQGRILVSIIFFNSISWLSVSVFFEWLNKFDSYIARTRSREAISLTDNASHHGTKEKLLDFSNIEINFSRPKTTSRLQSLDSRIIAALQRNISTRKITCLWIIRKKL